MKKRVLKTVRNTIIAVIALLIVFLGAGLVYVLITGRSSAPPEPVTKAENTPQQYGLPKPHRPNPEAPASAAVQSLISPVSAGSNSSIAVKTNPGSTCKISVTYNNIASKDSGLNAKTADDYGNVTWTWTVDESAPAGTWPVKVMCFYNKRSALVIGDLQITR